MLLNRATRPSTRVLNAITRTPATELSAPQATIVAPQAVYSPPMIHGSGPPPPGGGGIAIIMIPRATRMPPMMMTVMPWTSIRMPTILIWPTTGGSGGQAPSQRASANSPPSSSARLLAYDMRTNPSAPNAEPGTRLTWADSRQALQKPSESVTVTPPRDFPKYADTSKKT